MTVLKPLILLPCHELKDIVQRFEFYEIKEDLTLDHTAIALPSFDNGLIFLFYENKPVLLKNAVVDCEPVPSATLMPTVDIPSYNLQIQKSKVIRVIFHLSALSLTLGIPMRDYRNVILDLIDLDKGWLFVQEKLAETKGPYFQKAIIEQYLIKKLFFKSRNRELFWPLHQVIIKNGYDLSVDKIAKSVGLSTRHLNRLLYEQIGFSLTEFKRVHRFCRVIHYLNQSTISTFTEIAYNFDYYDQAHFIREFKRMSNQTPSSYLKAIGKDHQLMLTAIDNLDFRGAFLYQKD